MHELLANFQRPDVVILAGQVPLATGRDRTVYLDPRDRTRLIKVEKSEARLAPVPGFRGVTVKMNVSVRHQDLRKEMDEYARVSMQVANRGIRPPIANLLGFVTTDFGLGSLTEKVTSKDGELAPSLPTVLCERTLKDTDIAALTSLAQRLIALNVRASDLSAKNVVLGYRSTPHGSGQFEAVLVDGFADVHAIPIRTWSRWANRKATEKRLSRIAKTAKLTWDTARREFCQL